MKEMMLSLIMDDTEWRDDAYSFSSISFYFSFLFFSFHCDADSPWETRLSAQLDHIESLISQPFPPVFTSCKPDVCGPS